MKIGGRLQGLKLKGVAGLGGGGLPLSIDVDLGVGSSEAGAVKTPMKSRGGSGSARNRRTPIVEVQAEPSESESEEEEEEQEMLPLTPRRGGENRPTAAADNAGGEGVGAPVVGSMLLAYASYMPGEMLWTSPPVELRGTLKPSKREEGHNRSNRSGEGRGAEELHYPESTSDSEDNDEDEAGGGGPPTEEERVSVVEGTYVKLVDRSDPTWWMVSVNGLPIVYTCLAIDRSLSL